MLWQYTRCVTLFGSSFQRVNQNQKDLCHGRCSTYRLTTALAKQGWTQLIGPCEAIAEASSGEALQTADHSQRVSRYVLAMMAASRQSSELPFYMAADGENAFLVIHPEHSGGGEAFKRKRWQDGINHLMMTGSSWAGG